MEFGQLQMLHFIDCQYALYKYVIILDDQYDKH